MKIIPESALRNSAVVANCRMNRERQLVGVNSYEQELQLNIGNFLLDRQGGQ